MKKNYTILVVEDEKLLLEAIGLKMEEEKMHPIICDSGKEAFAYLEKTKKVPDLIWLDYYLADMDGVSFMITLEAEEKWKNIPVLVVSNSDSKEKINAMLLLGAKKYIVKAHSKLSDIILAAKEIARQ